MTRNPAGLLLIGTGVVVVLIGVLVWCGGLSWLGRLPGDIRIERPGLRVSVPITSMLLLSLLLSLVLAILRRWR
jgi:uncharacterized membrane-anchored protein